MMDAICSLLTTEMMNELSPVCGFWLSEKGRKQEGCEAP